MRRAVEIGLAVALLLTGCSAIGGTPAPVDRAGPRGPNVVVIVTDDQTLAEMRWMPRTRHLIGDVGVTFTQFLANHPSCCPARAQLLTGQYAQNNGVRANGGRLGGYPRFSPGTALPVWLQQAGYTTGLIGKYLNGYRPSGPEPGWDTFDVTVDGLYRYRGFTQYDGRTETTPPGHHTTYVRDRSADFLTARAQDGAPFLLISSYVAPHQVCPAEGACTAPPIPIPRDRGRHRDVVPPVLASPSLREVSRPAVRPRLAEDGVLSRRALLRLARARLDALTGVDQAVAATITRLRDLDLLQDTVVVFTSDNGFLFGEHRLVGKDVGYEEALRVPFLVRGPGVRRDATTPTIAAGIDLAPTIAELTGATPLVDVDGVSLVPQLRDPGPAVERSILLQGGILGPDLAGRGWEWRGVRTRRYTLLAWARGGLELYDRRRDRFEMRNLADDPRYAAVLEALLARLTELGSCAGATCRPDETPLPLPDVLVARPLPG
ncbi:sulfatase [Nocardioides sp.]|uniref:sulfatase family protein n=1 Tax=Nocardioides sp. TaxID=35761 RepID=UPI003514146A